MDNATDMTQFVRELPLRPRGRASVVLTHEYSGQKKWAEKLATLTDSDHLHLLDEFAEDLNLANGISAFMVQDLFDFLKEQSEKKVLIVSGIEFLIATWSGQTRAISEFTSRIENWNSSPCLLFVVQYDKSIANTKFTRHRQYSFVVDQKETFAL